MGILLAYPAGPARGSAPVAFSSAATAIAHPLNHRYLAPHKENKREALKFAIDGHECTMSKFILDRARSTCIASAS